MKTIAIMNQKGGIGKTMTAASIAFILAMAYLLEVGATLGKPAPWRKATGDHRIYSALE